MSGRDIRSFIKDESKSGNAYTLGSYWCSRQSAMEKSLFDEAGELRGKDGENEKISTWNTFHFTGFYCHVSGHIYSSVLQCGRILDTETYNKPFGSSKFAKRMDYEYSLYPVGY